MTISIQNNQLIATINSKGAELISLKNNAQREYIWEGNPAYWGKHSPVLFPIVGTLKDNQYQYKNTTYHLSRHGFARDYEFQLISKTASSAVFSLSATMETKAVYPFDFELQIHYTLEGSALVIAYKIINNTNETMPFSIGAHPAFAMTEPFESYSLAFDVQENLQSHILDNDLLSDQTVPIMLERKILPLSYSLFENDALIFKSLKSKKITLCENSLPQLELHFADFPDFGIWTKANAPFLCLEPWIGYSDSVYASGNILEKEGIRTAMPGKTYECQFSIGII